ncbi:PREDICTED: uncharacterized protein LOC104812257 [Tarenaya hassleriana]|uniref:uncharacterized protein LOC104812257 n=1 Tax=Tarenaya hassleriana TaxID=28532 RepID=UPI00053CAA6E|nr:PREDICTED: uncharacterized protein LOC104812257 [Tarenaya hassleriana]
MKFFGWMQNKLNGKHVNGRPNTPSASQHVKQEPREEFSDWPHGLLAIGTFGINNGVSKGGNRDGDQKIQEIQEEGSDKDQDPPSSSEDLEDFTPEEVGKLQKELTKLLTRTKKRKSDVHREIIASNLPLDRFLNCPSSLEVDRRISNALCGIDPDDKGEDIERTIGVILGRCKEISTENKRKKKTDIGKASVSYLLKKIFVCSDGFSSPSPSPSLRDTLQESRMEKLLRMMLHKKMNSQAASRATPVKRCLRDKQQVPEKTEEEEGGGEKKEKSNDGYKWVKTDSDFIVLEI